MVEAPNQTPSEEASSKKRGQFGLRTLLLVVAAIGSWLAWHKAANEIKQIKRELPGLRQAARVLVVKDASQFAAIEKPQIWALERRWEIHVPEGRSGNFHLALEGITADGHPQAACTVRIQPGISLIEYQISKSDAGWVFLLRSGNETDKATRSANWTKQSSFTSYCQPLIETYVQPTDAPLDLIRVRIREGQYNTDEEMRAYEAKQVQGELLWIELE